MPNRGRVICVDEFGPLNLQPRPGHGWFPRGRPARQRATYTRTAGVRHMFAALDLASGQLFYRFRNRKRWPEFLGFLRQLRTRFPTGRLFVVCDNFSPRRKTEVGDWWTVHDVELVFTPTHASWLNWIEAEFTALRYFTLDGSDYPSHTAQEAAIAGYVRWANKHATPKQRFAVGSKIRRPDSIRLLLYCSVTCAAAGTSSSRTLRYGPALSVVTSTGTGPWRMARVKNRRAAAVSRCSDSSTSMTCPYWSTARYRYRHRPATLT